MRIATWVFLLFLTLGATASSGGGRVDCAGDYCGTLLILGIGQPTSLLPPVTDQKLDSDIFDQIFLKLADIGPAGSTLGDSGFEPLLAQRWRWADPLTLVFSLDPRARWQDGRPVRARDVAFSFAAYTDSTVVSPYRASLRHIAAVVARDSLTVAFAFRDRYPEMFYDAVYHMRILPEHLLSAVPRSQWTTAAFGRAPVGDGPYRLVAWKEGESLELAADSTFFLGRPHIRRLIWRFATDFSAAVTQLVAGEADALQVLLSPTNVARARAAAQLALYPYSGTVYSYLGYNLRANGDSTRPHPLFGDPDVRRALILATDRAAMAQSVFAGTAKVPPAPIPQAWSWLWLPELTVPPYDTLQASRILERRGWRDTDGDGIRDHNGVRLSFHLMVPVTSGSRRMYARLIQEQLRAIGAEVVIDEVDAGAFSERSRAGTFDTAIQSWSADPSPSSGVAQLWETGGGSNYGHYADPAFDSLVERAVSAPDRAGAIDAWRRAFQTLNQDAPAIVLNAADNVAALHRRVTHVRIRPDAWAALIRTWRIAPDQLIDRDRAER
ncbi:MAG TPA: peptide ABC transporter substrate-binding protein [Gemmatimonadales bacterium]|nr:peptide ABC transporter substrate-binding protein [Gemmatimonadales bacterium]